MNARKVMSRILGAYVNYWRTSFGIDAVITYITPRKVAVTWDDQLPDGTTVPCSVNGHPILVAVLMVKVTRALASNHRIRNRTRR